MFGKNLNNCNTKIVEGFSAWYANGGSTYYAPSFAVSNIDGLEDGLLKYNATDYSTSLIGNYRCQRHLESSSQPASQPAGPNGLALLLLFSTSF